MRVGEGSIISGVTAKSGKRYTREFPANAGGTTIWTEYDAGGQSASKRTVSDDAGTAIHLRGPAGELVFDIGGAQIIDLRRNAVVDRIASISYIRERPRIIAAVPPGRTYDPFAGARIAGGGSFVWVEGKVWERFDARGKSIAMLDDSARGNGFVDLVQRGTGDRFKLDRARSDVLHARGDQYELIAKIAYHDMVDVTGRGGQARWQPAR